jgi:orotidine-5'-phosphate decarboxylase
LKLVIALDNKNLKENLELVKSLKNIDNLWFKVGFRSYIQNGKVILNEIKNINSSFKIFLDLKLYDIPNTMADTGEVIADLNVEMFNIHASSGFLAMKTVVDRLKNHKNRPIILSVTALTSFENSDFQKIYNSSINDKVLFFAKESYRAGVDGVVSSLYESKIIKENTSSNFLTLTPAIRPFGEDSNDQKRVGTISDAKNQLVNYIVIGRPIYQSQNPTDTVLKILDKL